MVVSCPIADMLTRIRNANQMRYEEVSMPTSKMKVEIASILKSEGFIKDFKVVKKDVQDELVLTLKYGEKKERVYAKAENIPRVLNGLGIAIISTSKGVMTDKEARKENVGGEVLAYVW